MEHLAFASALSLANKIRRKDMSARELLEFYLQRVEHYNPRLNAIIFRQDEQARQRADAADAALACGEVWGPLHGVPMTIKESSDWVGSPSTGGTLRISTTIRSVTRWPWNDSRPLAPLSSARRTSP